MFRISKDGLVTLDNHETLIRHSQTIKNNTQLSGLAPQEDNPVEGESKITKIFSSMMKGENEQANKVIEDANGDKVILVNVDVN